MGNISGNFQYINGSIGSFNGFFPMVFPENSRKILFSCPGSQKPSNKHFFLQGKLSFVVTSLMQRKMEDWSKKTGKVSNDFTTEAKRFAEANPRVDLAKSTNKMAMKSLSDIGSMIKSDFWELLKLANHSQAAEIPHFEEMLNQEIQSRLKWVASCISDKTVKDAARSDLIRYGMFLFAGLVGDVIAANTTSEDEDGSTKGKGTSILSAVVKNVSCLNLPKRQNLELMLYALLIYDALIM